MISFTKPQFFLVFMVIVGLFATVIGLAIQLKDYSTERHALIVECEENLPRNRFCEVHLSAWPIPTAEMLGVQP